MPDIETNSYIQYTQSELLSIESKSMPYTTIILEPGKKFNFTHKGNSYSFQRLNDVNYEEDLINNQNPIESNYTLGNIDHMSLYISPMSKVIFSQNENNYCLENSTAEVLGIYGIILLINTCNYLDTTFADTKTIKIDLSNIEYFKEYEYLSKNLIDLFAQQNNMSFNTKKVDLFIEDNFLALSGIAKKLTYLGQDTTNLTSLPNEILSKICSYLKFKDILPDVEHSVQYADDQTTPLLGEEPTE